MEKTCPHMAHPCPDCYCVKLDNAKIALAIHYCLHHYQHCPVVKSMEETKTRCEQSATP